MLGVSAWNPVGEGRCAANEIGFVPAYHPAKCGIHISDSAVHVEHSHARGHGVLHRATKPCLCNQGCLCPSPEACVAPKGQQVEDDYKRERDDDHHQTLLTRLLIDGHKHDAVVM